MFNIGDIINSDGKIGKVADRSGICPTHYFIWFDDGTQYWCHEDRVLKIKKELDVKNMFKIGDRVTAKSGYGNGIIVGVSTNAFNGQVICCAVRFDNMFTQYDIPINCLILEEKQMKKSDLKTGMKVVLRNGEEYIVSIDKGYGSLISIDGYGMNSISSYREDLKCMCINDAEWDICEIYKAQSSSAYTDTKWVSVWERADIPKIKEVTIKDIENKLGYKIKIVDKI